MPRDPGGEDPFFWFGPGWRAGAPLGIAGQGQPAVSLELRRNGEPVNPLQYVG